MKPFYTIIKPTSKQFKQLFRWAKLYRRFGAYMEYDELSETVRLYCEPVYVDRLGNMAIKRNTK